MLADMQSVNPEAKAKKAREKLKTLGEDADGNAEEDEDEEKEPEPVDDDFEGDEDEMAGDYDGGMCFFLIPGSIRYANFRSRAIF